MNSYYTDPTRYETRAIEAYQKMIRVRIEQGWHPSLLTFTFKPPSNNRALTAEAVRGSLARFYSLVLTRLIHHPDRGSVSRLPFMVGMLDLPIFKFRKVPVVATINDGLHAHAVFLTPPVTRNGCQLNDVLNQNSDLIQDTCHLMAIACKEVTETVGKVTAYVLKSLDLHRFDSDSIWIFPKSRSERTTASRTKGASS